MLSENDLELLSAYLDGALSEADRTALEARLQTDAELRRELARLRATVDLVKTLPTLTAPRPLTLTPRMVRRPTVLTSAAFSALSAAAAVILLIMGAALFTTPQRNKAPAANAVLQRGVAELPTAAPGSTSTAKQSGASADNAPLPATQEAEAVGQNDALQKVPTATEEFFFSAPPTQIGQFQPAQAQQAYAPSNPPASPQAGLEQAAPLALSSNAAGAAVAPAAVQPPTATRSPTATFTPTNTPSPTHTASPTALPTPTATLSLALENSPSGDNQVMIGVGLIVVALVLLGVAVVSTVLRRRA